MKRAIVVGSGAGGATVARELAPTFETTVLEAGPEFQRFEGGLGRVEKLRSSRLFLDPRMIRLMFPAMHVTMAAERHGPRLRRGHGRYHHAGDRQRTPL